MSHQVTLGFQSNSGTASVTFFDLDIPKDTHWHKVSKLLDKATNGGHPVKVPTDFLVSEILLSKPAQLSKDGNVEVAYPSGVKDDKTTATLNASKSDVKITAVIGEVEVKASK